MTSRDGGQILQQRGGFGVENGKQFGFHTRGVAGNRTIKFANLGGDFLRGGASGIGGDRSFGKLGVQADPLFVPQRRRVAYGRAGPLPRLRAFLSG